MKNNKKTLTANQKTLDINLWIIALVTMAAFFVYGAVGNQFTAFCKDSSVSVWSKLLVSAGFEFGVAGLGITLVCIIRKIPFTKFGLKRENSLKAVIGTILCFIPYIAYIVLSGQFEGYEPFSVMVTPELHRAGILTTIVGTLIVAIVWGFFEGFNYAVIAEFVSKRYPVKSRIFDLGAFVCTLMGIMFHPIHFDMLGMIDFVTTFVALYGMLIVRKYTKNSWGCVFAFLFIWNAI